MFGFLMSKEQKMITDSFAKLVKDIIINDAGDFDEKGEIPEKHIQKAWELGASVSMIPEEFGGFGMEDSPVTGALILEELAYGDMAFAVAVTQPSLFINSLYEMGTDDQKKKYLPKYCGEKYTPCSFAVNEPSFGFDAMDLQTEAVKKNGSYIINGKKCFVPLAAKSDDIMVAAKLDGVNNVFIINKDNPGMKISEREKNMGLYSLETNEVVLENCEIDAVDRLGEENGCNYDRILQRSRIGMVAIGTGVAKASFEFAKNYAKDRKQFGEPIVNRQSVAFMLAEMAYEVDAMRLMGWKAASKLEAGKDARKEAYLAKLYAGEMAMKITDYGVQIMGGHGYIREYPVERYYRNGRGISIIEAIATV